MRSFSISPAGFPLDSVLGHSGPSLSSRLEYKPIGSAMLSSLEVLVG